MLLMRSAWRLLRENEVDPALILLGRPRRRVVDLEVDVRAGFDELRLALLQHRRSPSRNKGLEQLALDEFRNLAAGFQ